MHNRKTLGNNRDTFANSNQIKGTQKENHREGT
jgi:hypothetical protein